MRIPASRIRILDLVDADAETSTDISSALERGS